MALSSTRGPAAPVPLPTGAEAGASELFRSLWPKTIEWVRPFYDGVHLFHAGRWLLTLEPAAPEPLLVAAVTHDMERHFQGGPQPDKPAGAWADGEPAPALGGRALAAVREDGARAGR